MAGCQSPFVTIAAYPPRAVPVTYFWWWEDGELTVNWLWGEAMNTAKTPNNEAVDIIVDNITLSPFSFNWQNSTDLRATIDLELPPASHVRSQRQAATGNLEDANGRTAGLWSLTDHIED
jgi:hypothetical protein